MSKPLSTLLTAVLLLGGCGGASPNAGTNASSSTALTCGDEPIINSDGTATSVGCSFYQQDFNISRHGTVLSAQGKAVTAGSTSPNLTVTHQCGAWLLGHDGSGVEVFVNTSSGEVRSHGSMHPGQQVSALPATLPLPIQVTP